MGDGGGGRGNSDKHLIGSLLDWLRVNVQPSASFRLTLGLCSGPGPMGFVSWWRWSGVGGVVHPPICIYRLQHSYLNGSAN
jgi:hypothetical protein